MLVISASTVESSNEGIIKGGKSSIIENMHRDMNEESKGSNLPTSLRSSIYFERIAI